MRKEKDKEKLKKSRPEIAPPALEGVGEANGWIWGRHAEQLLPQL